MATLVKEVMARRVAALHPDASLVEAAQLMRAQDIGDVLVAEDGVLLGVITDRDITVRAVAEGLDPLTVSCQAVCTRNPVCVGPEDDLETAARLMRAHAVRRLPVVDGGGMVGVVSIGDVAKAAEPDSALADISRAEPDS